MTSRGIIIPLLICVLNRIHATFKMKVMFYLIDWLAFETCSQLDLLCSVLIVLKLTILIRDLKIISEYSSRWFFTGIWTVAWLWQCQLSKHNSMCTMHYIDVIMTTMASQITSFTVVYSIVYSQIKEKHQSSASLAFVRGVHRDRWIPRTKGQ